MESKREGSVKKVLTNHTLKAEVSKHQGAMLMAEIEKAALIKSGFGRATLGSSFCIIF